MKRDQKEKQKADNHLITIYW